MERTAPRPALALALAAALAALAACADEFPLEPEPPRPFPQPDPGPLMAYGRCEDGALYHVYSQAFRDDQPPHFAGASLGRCPGACGSAIVACADDRCSNAAAAPCNAQPAQGKVCSLQGAACSGTGTVTCADARPCGGTLSGSTCTCTGGSYACTRSPDLAATHASLVGKWRGSVDPPDFSPPYQVSLWIYPDGTYWPECLDEGQVCIAFYYGGDGPLPVRTITVSEAPPEGASADIVLFHGQQTGQLTSLIVTPSLLTFEYKAVWSSCDDPFRFTLSRE